MSFCTENLACFKSLNCLRRIESQLDGVDSERGNSKVLELLASVRKWTLSTAAEAASSCSRRKKSVSVPDVGAVHHVNLERIVSWPEPSNTIDNKNNFGNKDNNNFGKVESNDLEARRRRVSGLRPSSTVIEARASLPSSVNPRYPVRRRVTCTLIEDVSQIRGNASRPKATTDSKTTQTDFDLRPIVVLRRHRSESRPSFERSGSSSRLVAESKEGVVCVGCQHRLAHHLDRVLRPQQQHRQQVQYRRSLGALHNAERIDNSGSIHSRTSRRPTSIVQSGSRLHKEISASSVSKEQMYPIVSNKVPSAINQVIKNESNQVVINTANDNLGTPKSDDNNNPIKVDKTSKVLRVTSRLESKSTVVKSVESQIRAMSNGATRITVSNEKSVDRESSLGKENNADKERDGNNNDNSKNIKSANEEPKLRPVRVSSRTHRLLCKTSDVHELNRKPCWNLVMETTRMGENARNERLKSRLSNFRLPQDVEDFYADDEVSATDPNLQLSISARDELDNDPRRYPNHPLLQDQESILSMDVASTGPTSLRSNLTDDTSEEHDLVGAVAW